MTFKNGGKLKKNRPHWKDGKLDLELTVKEGRVNITAKDGIDPVLKVRDKKFKNINEILEMLNQKL